MAKQDNPQGGTIPGQNNGGIEMPEVAQELSEVASSPKRNLMLIAGIAGVLGIGAIKILFGGSSTTQTVEVAPTQVVKPVETAELSEVPPIPQLPEPPKLVEPTAPPPPAPAPVAVETPPPLPVTADETNEALPPAGDQAPVKLAVTEDVRQRQDAKRKSAMILLGGTQPAKTPAQMEQANDFKKRGAMDLVLGKGKVVNAVLESAINTDMPGEVRALVSRDVYSESGKVVLIPKGTRVFGSFKVSGDINLGRISVTWDRIDLATGYTINLQSTGVDDLGREGYQGRLDNKFKEKFSNALMTSIFNVAAAKVVDQLVKPPETSEEATKNQATASNIRNVALSIYSDSSKTSSTKISEICTAVRNAFTDKSSKGYSTIDQACLTLPITIGATDDQKLASLMTTVNSASDALIKGTTGTAATPTKEQDAAKQGFEDITKTVKEAFGQQQFAPTITINQGTQVKIYVSKDYNFPKDAIGKQTKVIP